MQGFAKRRKIDKIEHDPRHQSPRNAGAEKIAGDVTAKVSEETNVVLAIPSLLDRTETFQWIVFGIDFAEFSLEQRRHIDTRHDVAESSPRIHLSTAT